MGKITHLLMKKEVFLGCDYLLYCMFTDTAESQVEMLPVCMK